MQNRSEGIMKDSEIIPDYLFSDHNEILSQLISEFCDSSSDEYEYVMLKGQSGSGKSYLLQYMKDAAERNGRSMKITTSETLTNEILKCIQNGLPVQSILSGCKTFDILAIENIELLNGKEAMQKEIAHLFTGFVNEGDKTIIVTCSQESMVGLEVIAEQLHAGSRTLECNLVPPNYRQRKSYVRSTLHENNIDLPYDIINKMAEAKNMGTLNGMLKNVMFRARHPGNANLNDSQGLSDTEMIRQSLDNTYGSERGVNHRYLNRRSVLYHLNAVIRDIRFTFEDWINGRKA